MLLNLAEKKKYAGVRWINYTGIYFEFTWKNTRQIRGALSAVRNEFMHILGSEGSGLWRPMLHHLINLIIFKDI